MRNFALVVVAAASACGQTPEHYSLVDNLNAKLTHEKLAGDVVLGESSKRNVTISSGASRLLRYVATSAQFKRDRIWGRLAHSRPFSTVAFREKDDPSTHVLFRTDADGTLNAEIHLDGSGPQKLFPHLDEFFFHLLTFRDVNQDRMRVKLERSFARDGKPAEEVFLTNDERRAQWVHATLGLQPVARAFSNSLFRFYAHQLVWKTEPQYEPMLNRFEASIFRNALKNTIEYGVSSYRQEDTRYRKSGEEGFKNRLRAAAVNTFIVPTPDGREFAYGRFAAILGTTAVTDAWHPWRAHPLEPNYARQLTFGMVVDPMVRSLWAEFGSDVTRRLPFFQGGRKRPASASPQSLVDTRWGRKLMKNVEVSSAGQIPTPLPEEN